MLRITKYFTELFSGTSRLDWSTSANQIDFPVITLIISKDRRERKSSRTDRLIHQLSKRWTRNLIELSSRAFKAWLAISVVASSSVGRRRIRATSRATFPWKISASHSYRTYHKFAVSHKSCRANGVVISWDALLCHFGVITI